MRPKYAQKRNFINPRVWAVVKQCYAIQLCQRQQRLMSKRR